MSRNKISEDLDDRVIIRKKNSWICVHDLYKKIKIRCSKFGREHVVPDTGRDKAQERTAEGYIRFKIKRQFRIK